MHFCIVSTGVVATDYHSGVNPFCTLLSEAIAARGWNQTDFSNALGAPLSSINNVVRGHRVPPLESIQTWCDVLELKGKQRSMFVEEALLSHCPPEIASQFRQLRAELMVHESGMAATEARVSALLVENGRLRDELEALKQR